MEKVTRHYSEEDILQLQTEKTELEKKIEELEKEKQVFHDWYINEQKETKRLNRFLGHIAESIDLYSKK